MTSARTGTRHRRRYRNPLAPAATMHVAKVYNKASSRFEDRGCTRACEAPYA